MNKRIMALAATGTVLLGVTTVVAQSDLGQGYFQLGQNMMSTGMMNHVLQNNVREHEKLYGGGKGAHSVVRSSPSAPDTHFTYDPKITDA